MRSGGGLRSSVAGTLLLLCTGAAVLAQTGSPASESAAASATSPAIQPAGATPSPSRRLDLGPAPVDAEGRFENLGSPVTHGSFAVRTSFFARRFLEAFRSRDGAPGRQPNAGAALHPRDADAPPSVTWVGHATVLIRLGETNWLTDPIWSPTASPVPFAGPPRFVEPGVTLEELPEIHGVLVSHNHYDHLDLDTLRKLARRSAETLFLVPKGDAPLLREAGVERVVEFDWGEAITLRGQEIYCLPARHWSRRGLFDERRSLWASWAIVAPDARVYFAGDTGYFSGFSEIGERLGPFDLAALPIGAYEPKAMMKAVHMNPEEAVRAARDLRARHALGIHFGTFGLTDEPLDEPPRRFREAAGAADQPGDFAWLLRVGETRHLPRAGAARPAFADTPDSAPERGPVPASPAARGGG